MTPGPLRSIAIATALWTVLGTLHGLQVRYGYFLIQANPIVPPYPTWLFVAWYVLRYFAWGFLAPLIDLMVRRYPLGRDWRTSARATAIYVLAAPLFIVIHDGLAAVMLSIPVFNPDHDSLGQNFRFGVGVLSTISLLTYGVLVLLLAARDYQRRLREDERIAAELRTQAAEARLRTLQSQLHPHFLFNTLHAISSLILKDPVRALEMVDRVGEFLRLSLQRSSELNTALHQEIDFLERYLAIEEVRFADRLRVNFEIDPAVRDFLVPSLILQPLVENAIRHGISRQSTSGCVTIRARFADLGATLQIEVEDNGPGLGAVATDAAGIGLANTRARLDAYYGTNGASLELSPGRDTGVRAIIRLPAQPLPQSEVRKDPEITLRPAVAGPARAYTG